MKGISNILLGIMILILVVISSAGFIYWGSTSTEGLRESVTEKEETVSTGRGANFLIVNVTFNRGDLTEHPNVTIRNNGVADLSLLDLSIYLNGSSHKLEPYGSQTSIGPGETAVLKIRHG